MLDTAIIGGGLCGLALARGLHEKARSFAVFEARTRLGGRVLSVPTSDGRKRMKAPSTCRSMPSLTLG